MMRKRGQARSAGRTKASALERIIDHLIATADPSRLFELYYWCQEAELLKIIRACASLPDAQRHLIASFFATMDGTELISANWKDDGQLVLCCQGSPQRTRLDSPGLDTEAGGHVQHRQ
jgi:hypothetical protein